MTTEVDYWVPTTESFGVRLVLVRHQMGWNAKEAALACGVAAQNWREWEQSGRRPRDYEGVCKQIAERTKCDLIWLMTGTPRNGWPPPSLRPGSPPNPPDGESWRNPWGPETQTMDEVDEDDLPAEAA